MPVEELKLRQINEFVKPFSMCCTPYYKTDFSNLTKKLCQYGEKYKNRIPPNLKICKVLIVGDVAVGKTSILNRFCRKMFQTSYKATIGVDFEVETFNILGVPFTLQIWDTAGQERFKSITQSYYRNANVVIIAFDLTKFETLQNTHKWFLNAMSICGNMQPYVFMVGSKKDLLVQCDYERIQSIAMNFTKQINAEFWSVSSKTGEKIDELFERIAVLTFDDCVKMEMSQPRKIEVKKMISFKKENTFGSSCCKL